MGVKLGLIAAQWQRLARLHRQFCYTQEKFLNRRGNSLIAAQWPRLARLQRQCCYTEDQLLNRRGSGLTHL
jgi:uncharacterized coiled-coil protein SlyX